MKRMWESRAAAFRVPVLVLFAVLFMLLFTPVPIHAMTRVQLAKDFTFTDTTGTYRDVREFSEDVVVLIYGRSGCSISTNMLQKAYYTSVSGRSIRVVFLGVDNYDYGIYSLARQYPKATFVPASSSNNSTMWSTLRSCGYSGSTMTLPGMFILDKYRNIAYYSTGYDYVNNTLRYGSFSTPIPLSSCTLTLLNDTFVYTGKAIKPEFDFYAAKTYTRLKKDRDYTVSYRNNKKIGTATLTVTGKNGFTGTLTKTFSIVKNGLKKGTTFTTDDGLRFKVTKGGKSGKIEVSCIKVSATSLCAYVPGTVTWKGNLCKVVSVGKNAAKGNTKLISIYIGSGVKTIGVSAFQGCTAVTYISLANTVQTIGKKAFYGCSNLRTLSVATKKLTSKRVGAKAFAKCGSSLIVSVPKSKKSSYKRLFKARGLSSSAKYQNYSSQPY